MARAAKIYRRLPGKHAGLFNHGRLWLGSDHLLMVRATGYSEEYNRFFFRDIQAIIARKTEQREIANIVFALVAIVMGVLAVTTQNGWRVFWTTLAGSFLFLLLVNWLLGPTCACHIRTAVQTTELPTLKRWRRARKVLERLRPLIREAQGTLAPAPQPQEQQSPSQSAATAGSAAPSALASAEVSQPPSNGSSPPAPQ